MKSTFRWGLPLIILAFLLWGSLFLYYPIEIRPLAALQAFLPDGDEIAKITGQKPAMTYARKIYAYRVH